MKILSNPYVRQMLITVAVIAVASRVKNMSPIIQKLVSGGVFNPVGDQNNTSTMV